MHDETRSTGRRALEVAESYGFRIIDRYTPEEDDRGEVYELADIVGRRIRIGMEYNCGDLIKATPMGEWVRDIEHRFPYWPDRPYVTTVEALEILLNKVGVN